MSHLDRPNSGFTLIELMLAMTFLSFLLIAMALTVIQISAIYNHGMTLKEVNQAGRSMSNELQRTITSGAPFFLPVPYNPTSHFISNSWGGRLCVGQYSYIWNYGQALNNNDSNLYKYSGSDSTKPIRFIKLPDAKADYCLVTATPIPLASAVELLEVGDHNLAIHSFNISSPATATDSKTKEQLYSLSFVIGTNDSNALVLTDPASIYCKGPSLAGSDLAYCSVQEFNIVARAGNAVE